MSSDMDQISICAVCETCPEGQKLTAVILRYPEAIDGSCLRPNQYHVENRTILSASTTDRPENHAGAKTGRYVVLELAKNDLDADLILFDGVGPSAKMRRKEPNVLVRQVLPVLTAGGQALKPWDAGRPQDEVCEPVVRRFKQACFTSARTGQSIRYNLCLPPDYDPEKRYPFVLFIHDKGAVSADTRMTLRQGVGATVWAGPAVQEKHPCIVLAPQYERVPEHDGSPDMLETTIDLCDDIQKNYAVDPRRVYATGQSMGCIAEMVMLMRHPDYFTACYLVAGQWEGAEETQLNLLGKKLFIIVSQGDPRAYPGMNSTLSLLKAHGARIAQAEWDHADGKVPPRQVQALCSQDADIFYAALKTEKRSYSCHMETWQAAYGIEGIQDWLFSQRR